ncbi:response regulator transcription factor [Erwinia billingiae]|uniref:response regulator transcription factor n=1 Tax=Erwinia billingiae TaxID=182337 RepID=UPI00069F0894|nr:response regulator transcription factor [Erwinia billingiae]PRB61092.1 DNA-binding response regulator [Erwinia billingiae]
MVTLLLIDDHPLVHVALEAALARAPFPFTLLAAEDENRAHTLLAAQPVDIVVLDIGLPDSDGLQLLKFIRRHFPALPVIIYSAQEERLYQRLAEAAGAAGYVAKRQPMPQLLSAILAVLGGQQAFPVNSERETTTHMLTSKEQQILALLARGLSNLQIAEQLNISNKTVSTHKKNIMDKTGASSVVELAGFWKAQQ